MDMDMHMHMVLHTSRLSRAPRSVDVENRMERYDDISAAPRDPSVEVSYSLV